MPRTDRRAGGRANERAEEENGCETHFGLGAKVDLIEPCQSVCQSTSQSVRQ